ncbi:MAG: GNAT family N-acetyltransferase [Acidimicrobiales bacterium]
MTFATEPLTLERFDDFADVINPNRRETHCWCLSHRLPAPEIERRGDGSRERAMLSVVREGPPGVVTYRDGVPVGWCHVSPRRHIPRLVRSRVMPPVDDVDVWSIICLVVRGGHRKQGVTRALIDGAVAHAEHHGAPAIEAYPVDPPGRMDLTMAFVGVKTMFDRAGFEVIGVTDATASKLPRLVMRRTLA